MAPEVSFASTNGWGDFAVSPNAVLACSQGARATSTNVLDVAKWRLAWADRSGNRMGSVARFYLNTSRMSWGKESSGFSQPASKYFSQTLAQGRS